MISDFLLNPYLLLVNHISDAMRMGMDSFPERYTMFHELDIITSGGGWDVVDGKRYELTYGDVFYRVPGMHNKHYFPYQCYFFVFDPYFNGQLPLSFPEEVVNGTAERASSEWTPISPFSFAKGPYLGRLHDPESVISRANAIFAEYRSPSPDWLLVRAEFLHLLRAIPIQLKKRPENQIPGAEYSHYYRTIMDVREAIGNAVEKKWSLDEAARLAQLSPNFFSRVFHQISGETFVEYVQRLKIKNAMVLLLDTDLSLTAIAEKLSFCDVTYFQTVFKRLSGITPRKFRGMIHHLTGSQV